MFHIYLWNNIYFTLGECLYVFFEKYTEVPLYGFVKHCRRWVKYITYKVL